MTSPQSIAARALGALAAILLFTYLALVAGASFAWLPTTDFYGFWAVGAARKASPIAATPYAANSEYTRVLDAIVASSSSEKLRAAHDQRPELDPTATPFFFAVFALLPRDYQAAQAIFVVMLFVCGLGATFALARMREFGVIASALIAAVTGLTFVPLIVDVRVGNVNALQLATLAVLLFVAMHESASAVHRGAIVLLALFVAFKPNTLIIATAFALQFFLVARRRDWARAASAAVAAAILACVAGAWYFGDAFAWSEWLRYARRLAGMDPSIVFASGNQSVAMWLAERLGVGNPAPFGIALGVLMLAGLAAAAGAGTRDMAAAAATLRKSFSDPFFGASFGILLTFAVSPIVWVHYLVLALVPVLWLARGHGVAGTAAALVAYLAMARPTISLLVAADLRWLIEPVTLASWLVLIPGTLAFVVRNRHQSRISGPQPVA